MSAESTPRPKVVLGYTFAPIPEWILYHPQLSPLAIRVYGVLVRRGMKFADCFPGHKEIAEKACISVRSVPRPLAELESVGAIRAIHRGRKSGGRTSDAYHLAGDEPLPPLALLLKTLSAQESVETSKASTRGSAERTTRGNVGNESQPNESHSLSARVKEAFDLLVERDVAKRKAAVGLEPLGNERAYRSTCRKERREDGTLGVLNDLANQHPNADPMELADLCDGLEPCEVKEPAPEIWCVFCQLGDDHESYQCPTKFGEVA